MIYYWQITPRQFVKHIEDYNRRLREREKEIDIANHNLGIYMRWAQHMPNKYPKEPLSVKSDGIKNPKIIDNDRMKEKMKSLALAFGGKVQNGN